MKKIFLAIAIAIGFLTLAPAAHAGPKFQKAMMDYLAANGETLESARHMKQGTTLTKGGFICVVEEGYFVSHCVEHELLAQQAAAQHAAARQSAQKASEAVAKGKSAPQKAPPTATAKKKSGLLSIFKHLDPPDWVKINLFYPLMLLVVVLAGLLVIAIARKSGRRYSSIGN